MERNYYEQAAALGGEKREKRTYTKVQRLLLPFAFALGVIVAWVWFGGYAQFSTIHAGKARNIALPGKPAHPPRNPPHAASRSAGLRAG